ncbi:MAG: hypothetical protein EA402_09775 [Planctomycetota bacterium]|nr:MAG: hypothetical protein EA402_09775 [Planctomycetota bacterium]
MRAKLITCIALGTLVLDVSYTEDHEVFKFVQGFQAMVVHSSLLPSDEVPVDLSLAHTKSGITANRVAAEFLRQHREELNRWLNLSEIQEARFQGFEALLLRMDYRKVGDTDGLFTFLKSRNFENLERWSPERLSRLLAAGIFGQMLRNNEDAIPGFNPRIALATSKVAPQGMVASRWADGDEAAVESIILAGQLAVRFRFLRQEGIWLILESAEVFQLGDGP